MVIMERSRSPVRPPTSTREPGHLVGFPVWQRPMGSGAPVPPPRQYPSTFSWNQQSSNKVAPPEVPSSQQSMIVPPGQPGLSQQSMGMSQVQGDLSQPCPSPSPSWRSSQCGLQGCGMAGMMQPFPPPPPSWGHQSGWHRPSQYGQNTPTPPRVPSPSTSGSTISKTPASGAKTISARSPTLQYGTNWKPDEEFYDTQKVNGLPLPRVVRSSSWSQLKDIEGCDPLSVPLSKLLYQGSENFWLRKLATGREVYVATMGEVSQVVFVSEILSQIRGRGIDLDRLAQHKALQDGQTLDKKDAIHYLTKQLVDQMQKWLPVVQTDSGSQHQIAALQAEIAELKAKANTTPQDDSKPADPSSSQPPSRVQSPLEAAFQGQRPVAFDPAQLLVTPGGTNQWLENNMPEAFSDAKYKAWYKGLKLDINSRQTVERNIVAMDNWWQNQPDTAESTIHRVAVCSGISPSKIKSGQNENLLKVLTVALTMTA